MGKWQVFMHSRWLDFTAEENVKIATDYNAGYKTCHVVNKNKDYIIDFENAVLTSNRTGRRREIRLKTRAVEVAEKLARRQRHAREDNINSDNSPPPYCDETIAGPQPRRCKKWVDDRHDGYDDYSCDGARRESENTVEMRSQEQRVSYRSDYDYDDSRYMDERVRGDEERDERYEWYEPRGSRRAYDDDEYDYPVDEIRSHRARERSYENEREDGYNYDDDERYDDYWGDEDFDDSVNERRYMISPHGRRELYPPIDMDDQPTHPRGNRLNSQTSPPRISYDSNGTARSMTTKERRITAEGSESGRSHSNTVKTSRTSEDRLRGRTSDNQLMPPHRSSRDRPAETEDMIVLQNAPPRTRESSNSDQSPRRVSNPVSLDGTDSKIHIETYKFCRSKMSTSREYDEITARTAASDEYRYSGSRNTENSFLHSVSSGRYPSQSSSITSSLPPRNQNSLQSEGSKIDLGNVKMQNALAGDKELLVRVTNTKGSTYLVSTKPSTSILGFMGELESQHGLSDVYLLCDGRPILIYDDAIGDFSNNKLTVHDRIGI